eukprot:1974723-Lingulodinium_polyedra.AAC.1
MVAILLRLTKPSPTIFRDCNSDFKSQRLAGDVSDHEGQQWRSRGCLLLWSACSAAAGYCCVFSERVYSNVLEH